MKKYIDTNNKWEYGEKSIQEAESGLYLTLTAPERFMQEDYYYIIRAYGIEQNEYCNVRTIFEISFLYDGSTLVVMHLEEKDFLEFVSKNTKDFLLNPGKIRSKFCEIYDLLYK